MQKSETSFIINQENIATSMLYKDDINLHPQFYFFHGGGLSDKERCLPIMPPIIDSGINVLTLDFSGHGDSSGDLKKSSLKKRVEEGKTAIDKFSTKENPLIVCGASMGGYIAIKMLEFYDLKSLILFCPALYDKNAYSLRFDQGFTDIIRTPNSWKNSDALDLLEKFKGNLLIIIGTMDEIIPLAVIELIMKHTPNVAKKELYMIPECPHKIFNWLSDKENELKKIQQKILSYL